MKNGLYSMAVLLSIGLSACGGDNDHNTAVIPSVDAPKITPILSQVRTTPIAVKGSDRQYHLVYELELRNASPGNAVLEQVDVLDAEQDQVLASFSGQQIFDRLQVGGGGPAVNSLSSAQFGVMYLHLAFAGSDTVPERFAHVR